MRVPKRRNRSCECMARRLAVVSVARAMPARITESAMTSYRGPGVTKQWALRRLGIGEGWNAAHLCGFQGAGNRAEQDANRQILRG